MAPGRRTGPAEADWQLPSLREALQPMLCTCTNHRARLLEFPPPAVVRRWAAPLGGLALADAEGQPASAQAAQPAACWQTGLDTPACSSVP